MGWKNIGWRIDLNNWFFGWDRTTWKDSDYNKEIFMTIFNKIISWNPGEPVDITSVINGKKTNSFANKATLVETLKKKWVMNYIWTFNISKIEEHLLNSEAQQQK